MIIQIVKGASDEQVESIGWKWKSTDTRTMISKLITQDIG